MRKEKIVESNGGIDRWWKLAGDGIRREIKLLAPIGSYLVGYVFPAFMFRERITTKVEKIPC